MCESDFTFRDIISWYVGDFNFFLEKIWFFEVLESIGTLGRDEKIFALSGNIQYNLGIVTDDEMGSVCRCGKEGL